MLVELGLVEQRYQAVLEVLERRGDGDRCGPPLWGGPPDGARLAAPVRDRRAGRVWRIAARSPESCPHQMPPAVEARIVELRRAHPGWGPRTILYRLGRDGCRPVAGPVSVYRALVRHGLIDPQRRAGVGGRTTSGGSGPGRWSCGRWTSSGGIHLADGTELSAVTGIDDHSPVLRVATAGGAGHGPAGVRRAGSRPCAATGCPTQILTDNGKVFTARFGPGPGRCCSTGSAPTTASATCSPPRTRRPRPARSSASTRRCEREFFDRQRSFDHHRRGPGRARRLGRGVQPSSARIIRASATGRPSSGSRLRPSDDELTSSRRPSRRRRR